MALYRTHRPQAFSSMIGQEHILQTLMNQVRGGRVAHAYLFSGPRGVGKTTTARILAKALNCRNRAAESAEPCGDCDSCRDISAARAMDVIEMDAASHTGVDNVRETIIDTAQFRPASAPYKIFIIDEVHMLSTSAFNALLKTLEEPPAHVLFILATTDAQKLPDTILSRCQHFTFRKLPAATLREHLAAIAQEEGAAIDADVLDRVVKKSDGCARDALSLLDQLLALGETHITSAAASLLLPVSHREDVEAFVQGLLAKDASRALHALDAAVAHSAELHQFSADVIEFLRVLLLEKATSGKADTLGELVHLTDLLLERRLEMKTSPILQFPLELAVVEWCGASAPPLLAGQAPAASSPPLISSGETPAQPEEPLADTALKDAWTASIRAIEQESPSTAFVMTMAVVVGAESNRLKLLVPFRLHKDKLLDTRVRRQIESTLANAVGRRVEIQIDVREEAPKDHSDGEDVAALFGGEVVLP